MTQAVLEAEKQEAQVRLETSQTRPNDDISPAVYTMFIVVLTLAATAIRFYHLTDRSLWIDEGASYILTQLSWPKFFYAVRTCMAEMSFYYFVLRLWTYLGTSETALRSLSVLFSVATVPLIGLLGRKLYSRKAGVIAAAIFSFHAWNIHFAQEARSYPLLSLLVVISWLILIQIIEKPSIKYWAWFSVITVLECNTHFLGILNLAAQFVSLLFIFSSKEQYKQALRSAFWVFLGCIPAAMYIFQTRGQSIGWIQPTNESVVQEFIDNVTGWWSSGYEIFFFLGLLVPLSYIALKALVRNGRGWDSWTASVAPFGVLVPFFGLMLISIVHHAFLPRYLQFLIVPLALGVGYLCSQLSPRIWVISLILVSAFFLKPLPRYYREPSFYNIRGAVNYIAQRAQPTDAVYMWEPLTRPAFQYYAERTPGFPDIKFPKTADTFQIEDLWMRPDPYVTPGEMKAHDRIWVIYDFDMPAKEVGPVAYFYYVVAQTSGHKLKSQYHSQHVQVYEFVRDTPTSTPPVQSGN